MMPLPMREGWGPEMEWPYPGVPAGVVGSSPAIGWPLPSMAAEGPAKAPEQADVLASARTGC